MVAVWMLYHLPESVKESRWLTGYAGEAAGNLYPGIRKEKFCRRHAIEKIMLFYGCVLFAFFFLTLYRLSDRVPELVDNVIEREDARGTPPFRSLDTNKSAPHAHRHKRRSLAVPLSFFTQRPLSGPDRAALPAALPDALHIPRTGTALSRWRSLSVRRCGRYFSVLRAYKIVYYHQAGAVSSAPAHLPPIFPVFVQRRACSQKCGGLRRNGRF